VLVVDDDRDTREMLSLSLTLGGADVRAGATAREALEILDQWKPDVLVSDIGMPCEDGYDLMRKVRSLPAARGGQVPAAALTGYASSEDATRARAAGYQMHVPKPIIQAELVAAVASLAATARREAAYGTAS
jgi:CheY-like chemotaxis protein